MSSPISKTIVGFLLGGSLIGGAAWLERDFKLEEAKGRADRYSRYYEQERKEYRGFRNDHYEKIRQYENLNKILGLKLSEHNGYTKTFRENAIKELSKGIATDITDALHDNLSGARQRKVRGNISAQIEKDVGKWVEDIIAQNPDCKFISDTFDVDSYHDLARIYRNYLDPKDAKRRGLLSKKKITINDSGVEFQ